MQGLLTRSELLCCLSRQMDAACWLIAVHAPLASRLACLPTHGDGSHSRAVRVLALPCAKGLMQWKAAAGGEYAARTGSWQNNSPFPPLFALHIHQGEGKEKVPLPQTAGEKREEPGLGFQEELPAHLSSSGHGRCEGVGAALAAADLLLDCYSVAGAEPR